MTTILPSERTSADITGRLIREQMSQNLPGAVQQGFQRQTGLNALDKAQAEIAQAGGDPYKIMLALAKAGAVNPGIERSLGPLGTLAMQQGAANREASAQQPGEGQGQRPLREAVETPMRQELPQREFGQNTAMFHPTNIGPQGETGNLPQKSTQKKVIPILTPPEKVQAAKDLIKEYAKNNIPLSYDKAMDKIDAAEKNKMNYNKLIADETKAAIEAQRDYGTLGENKITEVMPNATPEMKTIFKKKAEEAAANGDSEANIERKLAIDAKNIKDSIGNVEREVSAPRLIENMMSAVNRNYKNLEESARDVRAHLKPLLDEGLYDTARNLLQKKGYGKEETDAIINPLSERGKTTLNRVPVVKNTMKARSMPGEPGPVFGIERAERNLGNVKDALIDLKENDPNFSLVLARKILEDKGYDWKDYRQGLEMAMKEGLKLTDDQRRNLNALDSPPLSMLDRLLNGIGIIGR